jgi:4-hydroxy-tetrahydrodipicolinate synthase
MTQKQNTSKGVWTAVATPFKANGDLDVENFKKLLKHQQDGKVTGVVVCGTTGEVPTLSYDEKLQLITTAREVLAPTLRVMAGSGGNNTKESVALSKAAVKAGADSLLIVTPPYNKPSPAGLRLHYQMIADAVDVPLCLYHVPGRTAHLLKPETIADLCTIKNVSLVKEASGDIALFSRAVMASDAGFLSGDDPTYLASLSVGGIGVISVVSNIYPKAMVALTEAFWAKDLERARKLHEVLLPAIDVLFCETNPCPLKAALEICGFGGNFLRAPLAPVTEHNFQLIKRVLTKTDQLLAAQNIK